MTRLLEDWQIDQLYRVGQLIRNDWSGYNFDGRDVKRWIGDILGGNNIDTELKEYESEH